MHVSVNGGEPISFEEFLNANALSGDQTREIRAALKTEGHYTGGGGAEAEFTLAIAADKPAFYTVAIYLMDRAYGGPEEGGWWYDCGERIDQPVEGINPNDLVTIFKGDGAEAEASSYCELLNQQLDATVNKGRRPISSVLSAGRYAARVCDGYPEPHFPATRPHYE